jgi:hypothetical protein
VVQNVPSDRRSSLTCVPCLPINEALVMAPYSARTVTGCPGSTSSSSSDTDSANNTGFGGSLEVVAGEDGPPSAALEVHPVTTIAASRNETQRPLDRAKRPRTRPTSTTRSSHELPERVESLPHP